MGARPLCEDECQFASSEAPQKGGWRPSLQVMGTLASSGLHRGALESAWPPAHCCSLGFLFLPGPGDRIHQAHICLSGLDCVWTWCQGLRWAAGCSGHKPSLTGLPGSMGGGEGRVASAPQGVPSAPCLTRDLGTCSRGAPSSPP